MLRRGSWCAKLLFFLFRHEYPEVERFEFKLVANLLSIDLRPVQTKVILSLSHTISQPSVYPCLGVL
jgi:hypothetical protein